MLVSINTKSFEKQINNIIQYSNGFIDGVQKGKTVFLKNLGFGIIEGLSAYIDSQARSNPESLHHVYEWYQTGSPKARLFDLDYTVSGIGLSVFGTFKQSRTVKDDSTVPFYNKAMIMESGMPVVIKPKKSSVLAFNSGGVTVFTPNAVNVKNPGGNDVAGSFEKTFDEFMRSYFKQSFLRASGLYEYISNPVIYKKNISAGSKIGKNKGIQTGFRWITNAKIGVE
jgi:hypothetical protein